MNIYFYEGAAGTGKTYSLVNSLRILIQNNLFKEHQRVLALTFMHGSRRRLEQKLSEVSEIRKKFDCLTFDSFAWEIVQRWKDLVKEQQNTEINNITNQYDLICSQAAYLLQKTCVQKWISQVYPIIIVDEAQDLSNSRFSMLQGLSSFSALIVAGDAFQQLEDKEEGKPYLNWLRSNSTYEELKFVHRTNDNGLLRVATCLRSGCEFLSILNKTKWDLRLGNFKLVTVPSWETMAWSLSYQLFNLKYKKVAVLVLANFENIVENALGRVRTKVQNLNKKAGTTFGPFPELIKTRRDEDLANDYMLALNISDVIQIEDAIVQCGKIEDIIIKDSLQNWLRRRKRIGIEQLNKSVLLEKVLSLYRNCRVYKRYKENNKQVLTIHQAKNREFDNVVILWTFGIAQGVSDEYKRKLLYNAITRAKHSCTVILIQEDRLSKPPFSV